LQEEELKKGLYYKGGPPSHYHPIVKKAYRLKHPKEEKNMLKKVPTKKERKRAPKINCTLINQNKKWSSFSYRLLSQAFNCYIKYPKQDCLNL